MSGLVVVDLNECVNERMLEEAIVLGSPETTKDGADRAEFSHAPKSNRGIARHGGFV